LRNLRNLRIRFNNLRKEKLNSGFLKCLSLLEKLENLRKTHFDPPFQDLEEGVGGVYL